MPTRVQFAEVRGAAVTTLGVSFAATPTAGNLVVLAQGNAGGGQGATTPSSTVSDNQAGNTYTNDVYVRNATPDETAEVWSAPNVAASGTFTVTNNCLDGSYPYMVIIEYSGMATASVHDKNAEATGSSASADSGTTAALAQADEVVVVFTGTDQGGTETLTPEAGYNTVDESEDGNGFYAAAVYDKIVSSTAAEQCTTTLGGTFQWASCIATYKAAGGAADPEGPLVGGKLIGGGILRGRLIGRGG